MYKFTIPLQPAIELDAARAEALRRLEKNITLEGSCYVPAYSPGRKGYIRFRFLRRMVFAHRFTYETFIGPLVDGFTIDHLCRNTSCCNPDHLEQVSVQENIKRGTQGESQANKTHCIRGHEFTPENTYRPPNKNERICRKCMRMHGRKNDAIRRAKRRDLHD